jgi:hypothetical protein
MVCMFVALLQMNPVEQRRMLVIKVAAFVSVVYAYFINRLRVARKSQHCVSYAPMSAMDRERQANLDKIYNCNDIECVNMLRMRRAPFFNLCNLLRDRSLLRDTINSSVEEQVAMFLPVVGHNQRFKVIQTLGGLWKLSVGILGRC